MAPPIVHSYGISHPASGMGVSNGGNEVTVMVLRVKRDHLDFLAGVAASWVLSTLPLLAFLNANSRMK